MRSMFLVSIASLNLSAISRSVDMFRCGGGRGSWVMSSLCSCPLFKAFLVGLSRRSNHDTRTVINAAGLNAPKSYHWLTTPCILPADP